MMAPDRKLGVAVLLNARAGSSVRTLAYELFDAISERPFKDWCSECQTAEDVEAAAFERAVVSEYAVSQADIPDLDSCTGRYVSPLSGELMLTRAGNRLEMRFADMDVFNGVLRPLGRGIVEVERYDEIAMHDIQKVQPRLRVGQTSLGQQFIEGIGLGRFTMVP